MPLYEYQCDQCGRFELIHKFSDPPLKACPTCGGEVQKLASAPAIQFKGSGFYVNDYAKKSTAKDRESKGSETSSSASGEGKSGSKDASASADKGTSEKSGAKDSSATGSSPAK